MNTPIIQNLIPSLRETVFKHLKSYLGGEGELSNIMESLEFWYDRLRDKEHPDLPMWQDLPSNEQDQLFDAWHTALEDFFRQRLAKSDPVPSPLPVPAAQVALVEPSPASSPVPAPLVPEVVKAAQEALELAKSFVGEYSGKKSDRAFAKIVAALTALRNYSPAPSPSVPKEVLSPEELKRRNYHEIYG